MAIERLVVIHAPDSHAAGRRKQNDMWVWGGTSAVSSFLSDWSWPRLEPRWDSAPGASGASMCGEEHSTHMA